MKRRSLPFLLPLGFAFALFPAGCERPVVTTPVFSGSTTDNSPHSYAYSSQWGGSGSGNGQFNSPTGVVVDGTGNVYVTDSGNNRVQKFDSSGNYLAQWGSQGNGTGQFSGPTGVAVDGSGNVVVTDTGNDRIEKFTPAGSLLTQWGGQGPGNGQFSNPCGVAADGAGNIYVADYSNQRVQKFDSNGNYLSQCGTLGSGAGQFDYPKWVATDNKGNLYVSDVYNYRVEVFNGGLTFVNQWGSSGPACSGYFFCVQSGPGGIAVDGSGNAFVCDGGNGRVMEFTDTETGLTQFGSNFCTTPTQVILADNQGIALGPNGMIYVADTNDNRIAVFKVN